MARRKMRKVWLNVHKWLGLLVGGLLVLQGLTGSANVFYRELDYWSNESLWQADSTLPWQSLDVLARSAATRCDDGLDGDMRVEFPYRQDQALLFICLRDGSETFVTVDPKTAAVLGTRDDPTSLQYIVYYLHGELLLGDNGKNVLLILALVTLVSSLTGLYLWWPRKGMWRWGFRMRRKVSGFLLWFELHRVAGVYAFAMLAIAAITGLYQVIPNKSFGDAAPALGIRSVAGYESPEIEIDDGTSSISWQAALETAVARFPHAEITEMQFPKDDRQPILVVAQQPGEWRRHGGDSVLWLHPQTGEVVGGFDSSADAGAGDRVLLSLFPLHTGQAFGLAHRWLVFFAGLTPALLFVTGLVMWRHKVRQKTARKRGQRSAAEAGRVPGMAYAERSGAS